MEKVTLGILRAKVIVTVSLTSVSEPPKTLKIYCRHYDRALDYLNDLVGWEYTVIDVEIL